MHSHFTFSLHWLWIRDVIMTLFTWIHKNDLFEKKATFVRYGKFEMIFTFHGNQHFRNVSVNKTFTHVQEWKKGMSQRHSAYIPSSIKLFNEYSKMECFENWSSFLVTLRNIKKLFWQNLIKLIFLKKRESDKACDRLRAILKLKEWHKLKTKWLNMADQLQG